MPISRNGAPAGVVMVSQTTFRLLRALYDVRLRVFEVVLLSAVVAGFLSLVVSATIVRPLRRSRRDAAAVVARRGGIARRFYGAGRADEIGDLARALEEVTRRLEDHVGFGESFAADLSHEFKNPLASIRTVGDTLPHVEDEEERQRFLDMLNRDVRRLERLLAGVSDLVQIEVQLEREPSAKTDLVPVVRAVVEACRVRAPREVVIELAPAEADASQVDSRSKPTARDHEQYCSPSSSRGRRGRVRKLVRLTVGYRRPSATRAMSVLAKSSPLNRSGSPDVAASA